MFNPTARDIIGVRIGRGGNVQVNGDPAEIPLKDDVDNKNWSDLKYLLKDNNTRQWITIL